MEEGAAETLLSQPRHPYTAGLLASVPTLAGIDDGELATIAGQPPAPGEQRAGCRFEPRCPRAGERCRVEAPALSARAPRVACHFPLPAEPAR